MEWHKSSLSDTSGECVEVVSVGNWTKSSRSMTEGGDQCVEVKTVDDQNFGDKDGERVEVLMRDSKDPNGPTLKFTRSEWVAFLESAKAGEFDDI